jgi:hypothetical protein
MSEPLTIWECPTGCGWQQITRPRIGCVRCLARVEFQPRRFFAQEDVRPLWEALRAISNVECDCTGFYRCNGCEKRGPGLADPALDAFPAPEEWKR